jgi:hypothetical protein
MTNDLTSQEVQQLLKLEPHANVRFRAHHIYQQPTNRAWGIARSIS